jgi:hypothetical protein
MVTHGPGALRETRRARCALVPDVLENPEFFGERGD